MIFLILFILLIFTLGIALVWFWFFKNEKAFYEKLYEMGIKEFDAQQYKKARTLFSKVIGYEPKYKEVRYKLGFALLQLCDYQGAREHLDSNLQDFPKDFDTLYNLAVTLQNLGIYDEASSIYTRALQERESSDECYFGLGFINFINQKYQEALENFMKASELVPENSLYSFYINKCKDMLCAYDKDSDAQEIINNYLMLLKNDKTIKGVNYCLALAYAKLGQVESAEAHCKAAVAENPEDVDSYKILGLVQLVRKNYSETKNVLKTALNLAPGSEELHNILSYGLCYQVDNCPLEECREKYFELVKSFLK